MAENYDKEEFQKSQVEFLRKISTSKHDLGIQDELVNMRAIKYISGGKEGVELFDSKLMASFGDYQNFLMTDDQRTFTFDLLKKSKRMYEVLCHLENATDQFSAERHPEWNKMINDCLAEVKMENIL